jgi:hypothetical protein
MPALREIDDDAPVPAKLRFAIAHKRLLGLEYIGVCKVLEQTFPGSRGDSHQQHLNWDAVFARGE